MLTWAQILTKQPPLIHVPEDIIREIFSLLPVKSLLRFSCVCKSWKIIISDPQFIKLHLRQFSTNRADFTHIKLLSESESSFPSRSHISLYSVPLLFSPKYPKGIFYHQMPNDFNLIGICNGLVSFVTKKNDCYWVCWWNPATRLWSKMSPPIPLPTGKYPCRTFGFGYDALNDTYKAVVVFYGKNHSDEGMHVYRMGESSWRSMQSFSDLAHKSLWQVRRRGQNGVYLNGTLNWIFQLNTEIVEMVIVSIDLATEESSQMSLPFFDSCTQLILGTLKDSLCVLQNNNHIRFVIWQMKEFGTHESWTKLFNFDFKENHINMRASFEPVGFVLSGNHEILLTSNYRHVLYNKRDNTFRFTSEVDKCHDSVQNYVESLVSPR